MTVTNDDLRAAFPHGARVEILNPDEYDRPFSVEVDATYDEPDGARFWLTAFLDIFFPLDFEQVREDRWEVVRYGKKYRFQALSGEDRYIAD